MFKLQVTESPIQSGLRLVLMVMRIENNFYSGRVLQVEMFLAPSNSFVKILMPNGMILEGRTLGK